VRDGILTIFQESYRELRPGTPTPPLSIEFFAFANLNNTIRLRDGKLHVRPSDLLEGAPVLLHSIQRRNPYVDPLSFIQLVLLRRLRSGTEPRDQLLTAVLESINGIAAGLKNTG